MTGVLKRALGSLTRRRWMWTTGIALVATVAISLQSSAVNFSWIGWRIVYLAPWSIGFAWVYLLAIAIVEASEASGTAPSLRRYLAGALIAATVCVAIAAVCRDHFRGPSTRTLAGVTTSPPARHRQALILNHALFRVGLDTAVYGILATLIYARLRRSRFAEQALSDAKLASIQASHGLLAARLDAGRSAVDPVSVLRKLDAVEDAYERDPQRAEELMDGLIAELRDAIPKLRHEKHEASLAAAGAAG